MQPCERNQYILTLCAVVVIGIAYYTLPFMGPTRFGWIEVALLTHDIAELANTNLTNTHKFRSAFDKVRNHFKLVKYFNKMAKLPKKFVSGGAWTII
jgi:hypothetical protein